ncbi:C2H2 finger domain-containing protein, mycelia-enriched transcript [Histoplasma capsulatum]|uniref:C2H2 finger domain-containing protein, mycelia-enriched transcript n=1 Tax=Ajellomyces capsulatus TaxID=5037 RepID=A0A8A1MQL0_AJECA|nr:C2H2 finger domain-containing protein, mycelia-enriched transcript [Histoplasma capsulatum]
MAIYDLASKCGDLFDELVAHENDPYGRCRENQIRFENWAFHHDIFEPKDLSLDEKLRHNAASFQKFVEAHLMFLSDLLNRIHGTSDGGTHPQIKVNEQEQKSLSDLISEEAEEFKCVVKGVDDLYRLSFLMISRLAQCKIIDMLGFAHHPDLLTFQHLCWQSVAILYPYIHRELRDRLGASMTRRYAAKFHQKFVQSTVQRLQTHPSTMTAGNGEPEESNEDRVPNKTEKARGIQHRTTISSRSDFTTGGSEQGQGILNDSLKLGSKLQQTWSDQFHQENYPDPPKRNADTISCEWCSADLPEETLKPGYWRQHVNADLMPYPCIAEECTESHAQFAEFVDWFNHMQGHDENWHKNIYRTLSWMSLIQNNQETSIQGTNSGSINADIDDNSSCGLSTIDSLEATEEELSESASISGSEFDPVLETPVPDNDPLNDWSHIPRRDVAPEEDEFLQQVIKSGAYQSHLNVEQQEPAPVHRRPHFTRSKQQANERRFICVFAPYGCTSAFSTRAEWKRHVSVEHLRFGFYRCDAKACKIPKASSSNGQSSHSGTCSLNEFKYKDGLVKHLRDIHSPWALSGSRRPSKRDRELFNDSIETIARRCWVLEFSAPEYSVCNFCSHEFYGQHYWDERMDHVGDHLERGDPEQAEDSGLRKWAVRERLIRKVGRHRWLLVSLNHT